MYKYVIICMALLALVAGVAFATTTESNGVGAGVNFPINGNNCNFGTISSPTVTVGANILGSYKREEHGGPNARVWLSSMPFGRETASVNVELETKLWDCQSDRSKFRYLCFEIDMTDIDPNRIRSMSATLRGSCIPCQPIPSQPRCCGIWRFSVDLWGLEDGIYSVGGSVINNAGTSGPKWPGGSWAWKRVNGRDDFYWQFIIQNTDKVLAFFNRTVRPLPADCDDELKSLRVDLIDAYLLDNVNTSVSFIQQGMDYASLVNDYNQMLDEQEIGNGVGGGIENGIVYSFHFICGKKDYRGPVIVHINDGGSKQPATKLTGPYGYFGGEGATDGTYRYKFDFPEKNSSSGWVNLAVSDGGQYLVEVK